MSRSALRTLFLLILIMATTVGCALFGGSEPPPLLVSGTDGEVEMELGSYCWSSLCADAAYPPVVESFVELPANGEIILEFDGRLPDSGFISLENRAGFPDGDSAATLRLETISEPISWLPGVPAGDYILAVAAKWAGGDASYHVGITIP